MRSSALTLLSALVAFALGASGCSSELYCRLVIEDPQGLARDGGELLIVVAGEEAVRTPLAAGTAFPLTQVLSRGDAGDIAATIEVWSGGSPVGRDRVVLSFGTVVSTVTATLRGACDDDAACDDGVFANGAETCKDGMCGAGQAPCVAAVACVDVEANEELRTCVVTPRHERCEPITTEGGDTLATFCDGVAGCLPGAACDSEGAECPAPDPCSAAPLCVAGRCVPQGLVSVDDDNPCTIDLCDATAGVLHLEDGTAVGNSCGLADGGAGICLAGACVTSRCGDGYVDRDAGEACDDGDGQNSDTAPDACRASCALPSCGDGVTDVGEDCDDGNDVETDGCVACSLPRCGDGVVQAGVEACDDGNDVETDGCVSCALASCGDGFVRAGVEACDDGNDVDEDACLTTCALNVCGDGARNPATEQCDDGNDVDADACLGNCRDNVCGDGRLNVGVEQCDDANTFAQDACLPGCILNVCGDGVRDFTDEECDDGNGGDFDGCSSTCDFLAWEVDLGEPIAATSSLVAWEVSVDQGGTPVVVDALGVVTASGKLVALDRATGAELWRYDAATPSSAPPAVGNHGVYMITDNGVVHGNALAGPTARAPWTFALDRPSNGTGLAVPEGTSSDGVVAVDEGGKIYMLNHLGAVRGFHFLGFNASYDVSTDARAFDAAAQACPHCTPTPMHDLGPAGLVNDNGIFGLAVPMVGEVWAWRFSADCAPVRFPEGDIVRQVSFRGFSGGSGNGELNDGPFYATLTSGGLRRAEVTTNGCNIAVTRRIDASAASPFMTAPIITLDPFTTEDAIYLVDAAGDLHRFVFTPGATPALAESFGWPVAVGATTATPALGRSGDLYVADETGVVHAIDGIAAIELWRLAVQGGAPAGSPLVVDQGVFVATVGGVISALERGDEPAPPTSWSRNGGNVRGSGHPVECSHLGPGGAAPLAALALFLLSFRRFRRFPRFSPRGRSGVPGGRAL